MRFNTSEISGAVVERDFDLDGVPGVLWSPEHVSDDTPLVLMGHGGGLHKKTPAQRARARDAVTRWGFQVVAIDAPGHGDRPRTGEDDRARAGMRQAMTAGDHEAFRAVSVAYMDSLADRAVAEWRAVIDALRPAGTGRIGYGGGISMGTAIGVRLVAAEPRIGAAVFGGGFFLSEAVLAAARRITVPVQFLLPWDDEHVDRRSMLELFDAFATTEKSLHANPGDHRRVRWLDVDDTFLVRHLRPEARQPTSTWAVSKAT